MTAEFSNVAGDLSRVEGVTAADVWMYYCHHLDVINIAAWIDAQFSAVDSSSSPPWPLTEPVTSDMIAELHACPARVTDYLLDRLAQYVMLPDIFTRVTLC